MKQTHYMNPMTVAAFKVMFYWDITSSLLIEFLNALLADKDHIVSEQILKREISVDDADDYFYAQEMLCRTDDDRQIVVQLLLFKNAQSVDRAIYYTARAAERQGRKPGKWKHDVERIYTFVLMDATNERLGCEQRAEFTLCNAASGVLLNDYLHIVYIQIPLFEKEVADCDTPFDRWMYVFKHMDTLDDLPEPFRHDGLEKLKEVTDLDGLTPAALKEYQGDLESYDEKPNFGELQPMMDEMSNQLKVLKERLIQKAYKMKELGYSSQDIQYYTGLTAEEVRSL